MRTHLVVRGHVYSITTRTWDSQPIVALSVSTSHKWSPGATYQYSLVFKVVHGHAHTHARTHTHVVQSLCRCTRTQVCVCVQQCFKSLTSVCIWRLCMCAFSLYVRAQAHYVGDKCTLSPTATFQPAMFPDFIVGESLRNLMSVCICICFIMKPASDKYFEERLHPTFGCRISSKYLHGLV